MLHHTAMLHALCNSTVQGVAPSSALTINLLLSNSRTPSKAPRSRCHEGYALHNLKPASLVRLAL